MIPHPLPHLQVRFTFLEGVRCLTRLRMYIANFYIHLFNKLFFRLEREESNKKKLSVPFKIT